jgi:hypothetical protein
MTYKDNSHSLDSFFAIGNICKQYDISMKEVETTILRVVFKKMGAAPKCEHLAKDVIVRRDGSRPHCKKCWTWMEVIGRPSRDGYYKGRFKPIPSEFEQYLEKTLTLTLGEELK